MKPSMLYEALLALISERVPLHIWDLAACGESKILFQVADDTQLEFHDVPAGQLEPVDLGGLPYRLAQAK